MKIPRSEVERGELMRRIARSGKVSTRGSGRVSEELWNLLPRPEDPEGLLLKALLEDRGQGR
jgi:hypothetical protein